MKKINGVDTSIRDLNGQAQRQCLASGNMSAKSAKIADIQKILGAIQILQFELDARREAESGLLNDELLALIERHTDFYKYMPFAYFRLAADSGIMYANQAAEMLLGMQGLNLSGLYFTKLVAMESLPAFNAFLEKTLASNRQERCELTLQIAGRSISIAITAMADPLLQTCRVAVLDISDYKQAEHELQIAATTFRTMDEPIMISDAHDRIIAINPAFTKLTGYTENEALGRSTALLYSDRHAREIDSGQSESRCKTGHWQGEVWNRRKNGEAYLAWLRINTHYDANGNVLQKVTLCNDITDRKRAEEIVWKRANFDPLTGLPNRHLFNDHLQLAMKQANREGLPMALMFVDLDRFKEINDNLGHDMGDILLVETAQRLSHCVRETDTVARLGGDEFTIILNQLDDLASIGRVAQSILTKLAEPMLLNGEKTHVSASIGISIYPKDTNAVEALIKKADQAMYAAKNAGRNQFSFFNPAFVACS